MGNELIDSVNREIYQKFPNLVGKSPKITRQPDEKFLLIYKTSTELPGGKAMTQVIRVVCDSNGEISKITSSRG
jgi:hypothetical protein